MPGMSPRIKVKKGRPLANWPGGNTPPVINITGSDATPSIAANPSTAFTAAASDAEQGDLTASINWLIVSALEIPATAGSQEVDLGGAPAGGASTGLTDDTAGSQQVNVGAAVTGGTATGLANDATVYTAAVVVDGGASQPISIVGSAAQTYTTLIAELDADTTGATWSIIGGNLVCTSDSTGASSSIAITDTDLFLTLATFISISAAVPGTTTTYTAAIVVDGGASQPISIDGGAAQTFTELLAELTADTTGVTWSLGGNGLVATSDTTGSTSTIAITDTDLFAALTGFSAISSAVAGTDLVPEATVSGGTGGNPSLNFLVQGVQDVVAEVTDGYAVTSTDSVSVTVGA